MGNGRNNDHWLEHMLRGLYQAVVDEPLPARLLDIVRRIPEPSTNEALKRGHRWRAKAEEIQTVAASMSSESARLRLLRLARDYEALAESWERAAQQGSGRDQDTG